ncbi:MAG: arginine repressor, partial [Muribaculaceae bacterium]|nr:arginine repressor [Muribaculaceae bacterium]
MKKRKKRIDLIIELIRNQCIGSQEELAAALAKKGHPVTQATLSRDLKMLRTTKVPTDRGTYMYVLPDSDSLKDKIINTGKAPTHANYQ